MQDALAPKKRRIATPAAEVEEQTPESGSGEQSGGPIAEQLQNLFGNQVVEEALAGGGGPISNFASVLKDATELNGAGIGNAGPLGMIAGNQVADLGNKAREMAQGALSGGAQALGGDFMKELGSLPDMFSGMAMRDAKGPAGGFDQASVAGNIHKSSGMSLPGTLATRLSMLLGTDMSGVRIHTGEAAAKASESLNAHAFALGSDVFFGSGEFRPGTPEGDALIVHELTHVVQAQQGRLPTAPQGSGITTSAPSDSAEVEATQSASSLASMLQLPEEEFKQMFEGVIQPMQAGGVSASGMAMRSALPGSGSGAAAEAPESIQLSLGGRSVTARLPSGAQPNTEVSVTLENNIAGITFNSASVMLDEQFAPQSGTVNYTFQVGDMVGPGNGTASITSGGSAEVKASNVPLRLAGLATGQINVHLNSNGVEGGGTLQGSQFTLKNNFSSNGGSVAVELTSKGEINGEGQLSGQVTNVGTATVEARVSNTDLAGLANVTLNPNTRVVTGVTLTQGQLTGTYEHKSTSVKVAGGVSADVRSFMKADIKGDMDTAQRQWNVAGQVSQTQAYQLGNVTFDKGNLEVNVQNGSAGPMQGEFEYTYEQFKGTLNGTYDPQTNQGNGEITATLQSPRPLGEAGQLTKADAKGTMTNSQFESVTGSFSADLNLAGKPTFKAELTGGTYTASSNETSGEATFTLTRDLKAPEGEGGGGAGGGGGGHVKVPSGASASASISANKIQQVNGALTLQAADSAGQFAEGTVTANFSDGTFSGEGQATLTSNYGIPQRSDEFRFVKSGATLKANVTSNQLQTVQLDNLGFTVKNEQGAGQLDGSVKGTLDVPTPQMGGNVEASVAQTWDIPVSFGKFQLTEGGTAKAAIESNNIQTVELDVPYAADITGKNPVSVKGTVKGTYTAASQSLTGEATGTLTKDVPITFSNGDVLTVLTGSTAKLPVQESNVTKVELENVNVKYADKAGELATGSFKGSIAVPELTTTGDAKLTLSRDLSLGKAAEGTRLENWQAFIDSGSSLGVTLQADVPQEVQVDASGHLKASGEKVATGQVDGTLKLAEGDHNLTGTAGAQLIKEVKLKEGARFAYFLGTQTQAKATLTDSKLTSAEGTFEVVAKEGGTDKAKTKLGTTYTPGEGLSGAAAIDVVADIDVIKGAKSDKLVVEAGKTQATATVKSEELTSVNGSLGLRYDDAEGALLNGSFTTDWRPPEENSLTGTATITTLRDYQMGATSASGLKFVLDKGASVTAKMEASKLQELSGSANVTVSKGAAFAKGALNGKYVHDGKKFTGSGAIQVTQNQDLGAVYSEGKAILKQGAGARADAEDSELKTLSASIPVQIDDNKAGENFAEMQLKGTYTHAERTFTGTADAKINKEKQVAEVSGFKVFLDKASSAAVTVDTNEITAISGTVNMRADDAKGAFVKAGVSGGWTRDGGLNGTGTATLMVEQYELGRVGSFTVYVMKGAGVQLTVANNELTKLTGTVPFKVDGAQGAFLKGSVSNATVDLKAKKLSGSASMEIVAEQNLATVGKSTLFLKAGSGVTGTFADNNLTEVGGQLGLLLRRDGDMAGATFKGKMELGDRPTLTGSGKVTLLQETTLLDTGSYSFAAAKEGTSATISVTANQVDSVEGEVGFKVKKDGKAFVKGKVTGSWDLKADEVSGSGEATLEAPQEFANGLIKVLPGTGAKANITQNQLKEVSGQLKAELYATSGAGAGNGALANIQAEGTIDVVTPSVKSLKGAVTFNRSIKPFEGLEISGITGSAEIADNKLVKAGGAGQVSAPIIKLTGAFDGFWKNDGGGDKYWGKATANLDLGKKLDGHSARGITGVSVRGELFEDGNFTLGGKVNYALTDKIKGDIDIENEGQKINPKLGGTLQASGTLVEGRELFKWEKDLLTGQVMAGPIPIAYGVKGAMGLELKPVTFQTSFGVSNFYPLQLNVPDFSAELQLNAGADFFAEVLPYVGVGVRIANDIFTAMGGLEGQARAQVNLDLGAKGKLEGKGGQYSGELGISASVSPSATLSLTPFAEFRLLGMGGRHDFARFSHTFDDIFEMTWGTTYRFGDRGPSDQDGSAGTQQRPATNERISQNPAQGNENIRPSLGHGTSESGKSGPEGGPQIGGGDQESGEGQTPSTPSQISDILDKATKLADGISGIKRIVDVLGSNPVSAAVDVVLNWDEIVAAVNKVKTAIQVVADIIRPLLPGWWETLKGWIESGKNALGRAAGMVLDGGRWLVEGTANALRRGWNWLWGS